MDDDGAPYKKRRLQNACDECRRRKIKCDSANMPGNVCSNCLAFRTQCTHALAMAKKKRGPARGTPRGTKSIQSIVKSILSETKPYVVPEDPKALRQLVMDLAKRIVDLEEQLEELKSADGSKSSPNTSPPMSTSMISTFYTPASTPAPDHDCKYNEDPDAPTSDLILDFVKHLKLDHAHTRHFGQSSSLTLLMSAVGESQTSTTGEDLNQNKKRAFEPERALPKRAPMNVNRRGEFWNVHSWQMTPQPSPPQYTFPPPDLLSSLVDLYFAHVNPFFLILHRGIFEKSLRDKLHEEDPHFAAVVLVVCAMASRFSDDPRVLAEPEDPASTTPTTPTDTNSIRLSAGWKWFKQIRLIKTSFMEPPSIYELQLYCIAIYFVQGTSASEMCWVMLGLGVRFAQDLGIHRQQPFGSEKQSSKPTVESQMWNRAFWGLVSVDVVMSTFLGRPRAMHTDDFDVPLPIECDDEYWETEDPEQAFRQPPDKPCTISYWFAFLKLLDIVGFAQRTIYAVRKTDMWTRMGMTGPEWNEKIVAELDSALNEWVDTIPEHLKWNPSNPSKTFFVQSTILHVTFYWVQILIHRPFLSPTSEEEVLGKRFPSLAICANAARSVVHLVEVEQRTLGTGPLRGGGFGPGPFPTVMNAIYSSAIVLFLNALRGRRARTSPSTISELGDVRRCAEILKRYEPVSQVSGRLCDVLSALLSLCDFSSLSTKRPMSIAQGENGDYDDEDGEIDGDSSDSSVDVLESSVSRHPRPIAGSKRVVSASAPAAGTSSMPASGFPEPHSMNPGFQPAQFPEFSLPMTSAGLGSLPLHETFAYDPFIMYPNQPSNTDMSGVTFGNNLQESDYTSRTMAESLSTAFGNLGPDAFFLPFGAESQDQGNLPDGTQVGPLNHGFGSADWNLYMTGIDDLLRSQDFSTM
ncbi:Gypsy retrotransposon integrase-like protein 1 [Marasmius tenuissimus]|uniref:Gypsy retrotransposon integrase-like protein 1 n=1 Tax=Marasmius tenuissimus TaxID=585030 RepID=A0ABR2ZW61_9AGAR